MKSDSKRKDAIMPCPVCKYHAVEVSITSHTLQTWHRFECPNNDCTHTPGRFKASHEEAAADWNTRGRKSPNDGTQRPGSPDGSLETEMQSRRALE